MAIRRMFSKEITESDAFLEMPLSSQALYLHLSMYADDDGIVNAPKSVIRTVGASNDDLKILLMKRFVIAFQDKGVIVVKHWKINNYIQKDRYKKTNYPEIVAQLETNEKGAYEIRDLTLFEPENAKSLDKIECIHSVYKVDTQDRLGKNSIELKEKNIIKKEDDIGYILDEIDAMKGGKAK